MNNRSWDEGELADINLNYVDFLKLHPGTPEIPARSYEAFRIKRDAIRKNRRPTAKPKIVHTWDKDVDKMSRSEFVEAALSWQDAQNNYFREKQNQGATIKANGPIAIACMSDWHIGNEGTDLRTLERDINTISAHPRLFACVGGDPIDNFIKPDMGSAARTMSFPVRIQWEFFAEMVERLLPSLLYVSSGNHDAWTKELAGIDGIPAALAQVPIVYSGDKGLTYMGESGYFDITVGKQTYTMWRKHRPVRKKSPDNPAHFIKQMLMRVPKPFDIGISEHIHVMDIERFEWPEGSKIDRIAMCCGSYKIEDDYAKQLGFHNSSYGVPCVILYPDRRRMIPVNSIEEALEFLDGPSIKSV